MDYRSRPVKLTIAGALLVAPLLLLWWLATKEGIPPTWKVETARLEVATPEGDREVEITRYLNTVGMTMVRIPPGKLRMGEDGEGGEQVFAKPFFLSATEVTNGQFQRFIRETGYVGSRDCVHDYLRHHEDWRIHASTAPDFPVVSISWNNARKFCDWLTLREGVRYRLPTEAEWEYACRAGSATDYYWGDEPRDDCAWYAGNSRKTSHPVGLLKPNLLGLFDMSGNAEEWVHTARSEYPYRADDGRETEEDVESREIRGGAYYNGANSMRSVRRNYDTANHPYFTYGFRVAADSR